MRILTYTSKDNLRSVTVRERIGSDKSEEPYINGSIATPLAVMAGEERIESLPRLIWGRIIEVGSYIQQIVSLDGDWGDIVLPASESDEDRHAFYCSIMGSSEIYILTLQAALKEVNTSPLNPPPPAPPA